MTDFTVTDSAGDGGLSRRPRRPRLTDCGGDGGDGDTVTVRHRPVRSYVLREGRLTDGQRRALADLMPKYGVDLPDGDGGGDGDGDVDGDGDGDVGDGGDGDTVNTGGNTVGALNPARIFGRVAPLHLEIGFGDGEALLEMAAGNPGGDYLGAEVHRPGVGRALLQIEARGLANLRVCRADGARVLRALPPASLAAVYLYFPDPWPKKRHHKRRLLQAQFIALAASRLVRGGRFHFATDWRDYALEALARLEECAALANCARPGRFSPRPPTRPQTKFERRGRRLGHAVWDIVMRRV